ncbi:hypothetical protein AcV5_003336 [Taiwanofungus camphoratus]|nr:hypothetical protein AcV5_003336 [Antrodia cinnamomea]
MASHRIISSAKESQGAETSRQGLSIISDPFDPLIKLCNGDPALIQAHYIRHRNDRVEQQLSKFLSSTFTGLVTDPVLNRLSEPNYIDNRHGINFCARPPLKIRQLIAYIQKQLLNTAPSMHLIK